MKDVRLLKNPSVRFLIFIFLFYISWYLLYYWWIHPMETVDLFVIDITVSVLKWLLELLNYSVFTGADRLIGIDGSGGLWIGDSCNGIVLFALFTGFIVSYKGNWRYKTVYIALGIISIELINVLRLACLAIIDTHSRALTEFNHTYTFTIIIYAYIFMLWIIWVNKFAQKEFFEAEKSS